MTSPPVSLCRYCGLTFAEHKITIRDETGACSSFMCNVGEHIPEQGGATGYCSVCGKRVDS